MKMKNLEIFRIEVRNELWIQNFIMEKKNFHNSINLGMKNIRHAMKLKYLEIFKMEVSKVFFNREKEI